jgi:hypothetical protein
VFAGRVNGCEILQVRAFHYFRTPVAGQNLVARLSLSGLRKFSATCLNSKVFKDDSPMDEEAFVFGAFHLLPAQRMLLEDGKPVHLGSRALDVLVALVQSAGDTLHKDQLIARAIRSWTRAQCGSMLPRCANEQWQRSTVSSSPTLIFPSRSRYAEDLMACRCHRAGGGASRRVRSQGPCRASR